MAAADIGSSWPENGTGKPALCRLFRFRAPTNGFHQNPAAHVKNVTKNQRLCA
jgi:hypothetical protein